MLRPNPLTQGKTPMLHTIAEALSVLLFLFMLSVLAALACGA
jgi:hypothetical protein